MAEIHVHNSIDPALLDMLEEWLRFWSEADSMPSKMPNALHVRTAVALSAAGRDVQSVMP